MTNYFHMARIAMLCAERNIRAYTRVESDTQTVRLGISPLTPNTIRQLGGKHVSHLANLPA